jgi:hypothetical protein
MLPYHRPEFDGIKLDQANQNGMPIRWGSGTDSSVRSFAAGLGADARSVTAGRSVCARSNAAGAPCINLVLVPCDRMGAELHPVRELARALQTPYVDI